MCSTPLAYHTLSERVRGICRKPESLSHPCGFCLAFHCHHSLSQQQCALLLASPWGKEVRKRVKRRVHRHIRGLPAYSSSNLSLTCTVIWQASRNPRHNIGHKHEPGEIASVHCTGSMRVHQYCDRLLSRHWERGQRQAAYVCASRRRFCSIQGPVRYHDRTGYPRWQTRLRRSILVKGKLKSIGVIFL